MPAEQALDVAPYASALADGIEAALPRWVSQAVARRVAEWGGDVPPDVAADADLAGRRAAAELGPRVRSLLATDIDEQETTPLALVRAYGVPYPTEVLTAAGVPPVARDRAAEDLFPGDVYDLAPGSFADLDPELADAGLHWGAAKAFEHKRRHGSAQSTMGGTA